MPTAHRHEPTEAWTGPRTTSSTNKVAVVGPSAPMESRVQSQHVVVPQSRRRSHRLSVERLAPHQLSEGEQPPTTLMKGFLVLLTVMRHVSTSVVFVWFANFCSTQGNFLSSTSLADQSYAEFMLTVMLWNHFFVSVFVLVIQATILVKQTFVTRSTRKTTLGFCIRRLFQATWMYYAVTFLLVVAANQLVSRYAVSLNTGLVKYRIEFYLGCTICLGYMVSLTVASGRIFRTETVAGRERSVVRPSHGGGGSRHTESWRSALRSSRRAFAQHAPKTMVVMSACLCLQLMSSVNVTHQREFVLFALGSVIAKLVLQELAKAFMVWRNVQDHRSMYGIIALPTILIDTQVRIVLQQVQSTQTTYSGIILMAFVELMMRAGKVVLLKLVLYRDKRRVLARLSRVSQVLSPQLHALETNSRNSTRSSRSDTISSFTRPGGLRTLGDYSRHEQRAMRFHAAESYADMAAEYIAIGCSTSIIFFYSHHPKYSLSHTGTTATGSGLSLKENAFRLGLQLGVELVVDFASCVLEIRGGVDFQDLHRHRVFLGAVLVCIGVLNVQISAFVYVHA